MKVLVIGAAGKTGKAVTEQAVAAGHQVTAFVHTAEDYKVPYVRVLEGDAADSAAMDAAVSGQDAVLDTIASRDDREGLKIFGCTSAKTAHRLPLCLLKA